MNIKQTDIDRFWIKVEIKNPNECWEWKGSRRQRYGKFKLGLYNKMAHRVSYQIAYGEFDETLYVCHHCDNTFCVNPNHLFLGTQLDNMRDMVAKGRNPNTSGEKNGRANLTDEQVTEIRAKYSTGEVSRETLSVEYGVPKGTINNILSNNTWTHLPPAPRIIPRNRKLTKELALQIIETKQENPRLSQEKVGRMFGISQAVVSRVLLGQASGWE